ERARVRPRALARVGAGRRRARAPCHLLPPSRRERRAQAHRARAGRVVRALDRRSRESARRDGVAGRRRRARAPAANGRGSGALLERARPLRAGPALLGGRARTHGPRRPRPDSPPPPPPPRRRPPAPRPPPPPPP